MRRKPDDQSGSDQPIEGEPSVALSIPNWVVVAIGVAIIAALVIAALLPMKAKVISLPG